MSAVRPTSLPAEPSQRSPPIGFRVRWGKTLRSLRGAQGHTAASATALLMLSSFCSGLLALVRIKYINAIFGAGVQQDAYQAAFTLPDLLNYFLIGGAASISLITMLNRYREAGDEAGADRALSVILTNMLLVLGAGVLLGEIFAPAYVSLANKGFPAETHALCTSLTRVMLPVQLFILVGSMMGARLQVRKIFLYQALMPVIYNGCIIGGAVLLHRQIGVYGLAVGVLVGMLVGSALLNTLGAWRTGLRFRPVANFRDPAFREWLRLSLPLMVGVSLVMFDGVFMKRFASPRLGGVTLISVAKNLFNAPFNVIGPAAGAASLPFFASLFQSGRRYDFSVSVGRSVSRLFSVGLLVSAWMIALAPWLMDLFRGGRFNRADARETRLLFSIFALTLAIWAVQGIYARAFYAASDTRTPAVTGTVITLLSVPLYGSLFRAQGLTGLAIASDLGITAQTCALAFLLHRKRLVSLLHLEGVEIGRALIAALCAAVVTGFVVYRLPPTHSHAGDTGVIAVGSLVWLLVAGGMLRLTGSKLPDQVMRKRQSAA